MNSSTFNSVPAILTTQQPNKKVSKTKIKLNVGSSKLKIQANDGSKTKKESHNDSMQNSSPEIA